MTVASEENRSGPYTGNGVTTVFAYGFRILNENHIKVIRTQAGVETVLTIDADYIVSDVGAAGGGQVALTVAPTAAQTVTILRDVPFTQETDLENQGPYFAETIEASFDLAAMRDQQLQELLSRTIRAPASSPEYDPDQLVNDILNVRRDRELTAAARDAALAAQLAAEVAAAESDAANSVNFATDQSLGLVHLRTVQANVNLPAIHRRPIAPWLPKWGAARANVLAGISNAKLLCLGDSTTAGFGARPGNVNSIAYSYPTVLANLLTAAGLNSSWQSRWADNNSALSGYTINSWDARCNGGDGYAPYPLPTLGGGLFMGTAPYTMAFSFTPATPFDKVDLYDTTTGTAATYVANISGVGTITPSQAAAPALRMQTISATLGSNSLIVAPTSANPSFFIGAIAYNSAVKEVSIINAGFGGGTAGTFNSGTDAWSPLNVLGFLAPDLTIIDLTINDAILDTALANYMTNLEAIVVKAKLSGDVILLGGVPIDPSYGGATLAKQTAINNIAAAIAAKNGANYISMFDLWGSFTAINNAGWSSDLQIHPNAAGYAAQAALLAPHLL